MMSCVANRFHLVQVYAVWILAAQVIWVAAFSLFVGLYAPLLVKPRVDGRYG